MKHPFDGQQSIRTVAIDHINHFVLLFAAKPARVFFGLVGSPPGTARSLLFV